MSELIYEKLIEEEMLAFVLLDYNKFRPVEKKVLNEFISQNETILKCYQITYNGKMKFLYHIKQYETLSGLLQKKIQLPDFCNIIAQLLKALAWCDGIGYLKPNHILMELDSIYIDEKGMIKIIYLPFEDMKNVNFCEWAANIASAYGFMHPCLEKLFKSTEDSYQNLLSLFEKEWRTVDLQSRNDRKEEDFFEKTNVLHYETRVNTNFEEKIQIQLVCMDIEHPMKIEVREQELLLGRANVRGTWDLRFQPTISKKHALMIRKEDAYYLKDCGSSNGTFLNSKKIKQGMEEKVKKGDVIRLGNINFRVE